MRRVYKQQRDEISVMSLTEDPFQELRSLRKEISFTEEEIAEMILESKEAWRRKPPGWRLPQE